MKAQQHFLENLQEQAKLQSELSSSHVLPKQFDGMAAFVGNYPWQFLLVSSGVTALVLCALEFLRK